LQTLAAAALAMTAASAARGQQLPFVHAASAYSDVKGVPLKGPEGVACSDSGRVVLADTGNGRLVSFDWRGGAFEGGAVLALPEPGAPAQVQIDGSGSILALDRRGRRVARLSAKGEPAGYVALRNIPASAAGFFPSAFKLDRSNQIWIVDSASARVLLFDPAGAFVKQMPLPAGSAVIDVAVGPRGTVYAVDGAHAVVYEASPGSSGFRPLTQGLREHASFPSYVAPTDRGLMLLVDGHGMGIVLLAPDGSYVGRRLAMGRSDGLLYYPGQICFSRNGELFVADRENHRLQAFTSEK